MVHLVGYATAGLGLGEVLRRLAGFLHGQGLTFAVHDLRAPVEDRGRDLSLLDLLPAAAFSNPIGPHDPVIFCVNPDQLNHAIASFPVAGRRIGLWFWELEQWPQAWYPAFDLVDEVWAPTSFIEKALVAASATANWSGPIYTVPLPLMQSTRNQPSNEIGQSASKPIWWDDWAQAGAHRSYFSFDCHSVVARKNPLALIEGFKRAFPIGQSLPQAHPQPRLLVRALHAERDAAAVQALKDHCNDDPRILVQTDYLCSYWNTRLIELCDVYCSPHRSEGLGLGIAEAMLMGKAVIATPWSGNMDFCFDAQRGVEYGIHLAYELIALNQGDYPYGDGCRWANPCIHSLSTSLRTCWLYPAWASSVGRASMRHIKKQFNGEIFLRHVKRLLSG